MPTQEKIGSLDMVIGDVEAEVEALEAVLMDMEITHILMVVLDIQAA
jgi:hypothetical protein